MERYVFSLMLALTGMCAVALAQPAGRLFVLNEGAFGGALGSFGVVDFQSGQYTHIDSVSQYGNQILLHDGRLYVVDGTGNVLIYNADNAFAPLDTIADVGARYVQVYGDQLLVSGIQQPYFSSYDISAGYALRYGLDSTRISTTREEFTIVGDKAYVTGFFNDTLLAVVDLVAEDTLTFIPTATNNYQIEVIGASVFVACYAFTPSFDTDATLLEIDPTADTVIRSFFLPNAGDLTASGTHLYLKSPQGEIFRYDAAQQTLDTMAFGQAFYGFTFDAASDMLFVSRTDFFSTGEVAYIAGDSLSDFVATHISPRAFYFDAITTPIEQGLSRPAAIRIYPNPASGSFFIKSDQTGIQTIRLLDMQGRQVQSWKATDLTRDTAIPLQGVPAGMYLVQLIGSNRLQSHRLVVE